MISLLLTFAKGVPTRVWVYVGLVVAVVSLGGWLYHSGEVTARQEDRMKAQDIKLAAARKIRYDAIKAAVDARHVQDTAQTRADTAVVQQRALRKKVRVVDEQTLVVSTSLGDTTVTVPREVVALIQQDSLTIRQLQTVNAAQANTIAKDTLVFHADGTVIAVSDSLRHEESSSAGGGHGRLVAIGVGVVGVGVAILRLWHH